jgi:hypothetical protein
MLYLDRTKLDERQAHGLLRRLRDLNLRACPVTVSAAQRVVVDGCLSVDAPVEGGVRYALRGADGAETVLELCWTDGRLALALDPPHGPALRRTFELVRDRRGRAIAPELRARVPLETVEPRRLEHFVRRVVRAACALPPAAA